MRGWRHYNNLVHRYLGYACVGMTLVYAVSGVALNHSRRINPDYMVRVRRLALPLAPPAAGVSLAYFRDLGDRAGISGNLKGIIPGDGRRYRLVFSGVTLAVDLEAKTLEIREKRPRPLLRRLNFLHLNQPRALWTFFADTYCVALVLLAMTGVMVRGGSRGIMGPGGMVLALGMLLPFFFIWLYYR